jgi:hypothetical protein
MGLGLHGAYPSPAAPYRMESKSRTPPWGSFRKGEKDFLHELGFPPLRFGKWRTSTSLTPILLLLGFGKTGRGWLTWPPIKRRVRSAPRATPRHRAPSPETLANHRLDHRHHCATANRLPTAFTATGALPPPSTLVVVSLTLSISLSLSCGGLPVFYPDSSVTRKRCRIFTNIFCVVHVLDHTFDAVMPSLYVLIPSEVLHARH